MGIDQQRDLWERGPHFLCFAALTVLAFASRWPLRQGLLVGLLVAYAVGIEAAQGFFPPREVAFLDLLENTLGVVAVAGFWWIVQRPSRFHRQR